METSNVHMAAPENPQINKRIIGGTVCVLELDGCQVRYVMLNWSDVDWADRFLFCARKQKLN
jgi:hypothetical protein